MSSTVNNIAPQPVKNVTYPYIGELTPGMHPFDTGSVLTPVELLVLFTTPGSGMVIGTDPKVDGSSTTSRTVNWAKRFTFGKYSSNWHEDSFKKLPAAKTVTITNS